MKTAIEGVYKGIKEFKAGSFKNSNGDIVNYNEFYRIYFDQILNGFPKECYLTINKELALRLVPMLKTYDNIVLNLNVNIYSNKEIYVSVVSIEKK